MVFTSRYAGYSYQFCVLINFRAFFILLATLPGLRPGAYGQSKLVSDSLYNVLPTVVVSSTPLSRTGLLLDQVPVKVQRATAEEMRQSRSLDISSYLNKHMASVHINEAGGNPLQPDVSYRGFQASPLLGLPQGLSVYQDGVRLNELFGDVVNWDLIPFSAFAEMELISGANPLFGLNTLGGALFIKTKSGFSHPGHAVSAAGGRFGRFIANASSGQAFKNMAYYAAAEHFREEGWRDYSQSRASRFFGKGSYRKGPNQLSASFSFGSSRLRGNGATPYELLALDRSAVFTHPDMTIQTARLFNLKYSRELDSGMQLAANVYVRNKQINTFNGDDSPFEENEEGYLALEDEEAPLKDQMGRLVPATGAVSSAVNNITNTREWSYGSTFQLSLDRHWLGRKNLFIAGLSFDGGEAHFDSALELARLTDSRGTEGSGLYTLNGFTELITTSQKASIFLMDAIQAVDKWFVTFSSRLDYSRLRLHDQLGTALNGDHSFLRLNPALGLVYERTRINYYANASIASRTPSPVELSCADPDAPCRLPNAFLADPPLDVVVAGNLETGLRAKPLQKLNWQAGLFHTRLYNDIYFISAGPGRSSGYFDNLGTTSRSGLELSLAWQGDKFRWQLHYTYLRAVFEQDFWVSSVHHPQAVQGEILVRRGSHVPLIPNHLFKSSVSWPVIYRLSLGANFSYTGRQYLRSDEANLLQALPDYALLGVQGTYTIVAGLTAYLNASNIFNASYATFGVLGEPDEVAGFESFSDPRFFTPGQPAYWEIGLEWQIRKN